MLPSWARRVAGLDPDLLVLRLSDGLIEVQPHQNNKASEAVSIPWEAKDQADPVARLGKLLAGRDTRQYRVVLALDPALTLRRKLQVPRAAEAELRGVLAFEIERHTPFREHEVYFHHVIDRDSGDDAAMAVDLTIVPRRIIEPVISGLHGLDIGLDQVVVGEIPGDGAVPIPVEGVAIRRRRRSNGFRLMVALTVLLGIAAATSPLLRLKYLTRDLAVFVEQAKIEAETSLALQQEISRLTQGMNLVVRAKAEASSPLAVLRTLSDLLPDGTWVVRLSVVGDEVILEGRTDSSSRLVGLLEASPLFDTVKYLAPITRDADGDFERFNFSLRLSRG